MHILINHLFWEKGHAPRYQQGNHLHDLSIFKMLFHTCPGDETEGTLPVGGNRRGFLILVRMRLPATITTDLNTLRKDRKLRSNLPTSFICTMFVKDCRLFSQDNYKYFVNYTSKSNTVCITDGRARVYISTPTPLPSLPNPASYLPTALLSPKHSETPNLFV